MATKTKKKVVDISSAVEAYTIVRDDVNARKDDKPRNFEPTTPFEDKVRQGDINIMFVGNTLADVNAIEAKKKIVFNAKSKEAWSNKFAQLAPGDTQGSRHILECKNTNAFTIFNLESANPLQGPIVHCSEDFSIVHPEHGAFNCKAGAYFISYQRAYAEELRRVRD